MNTEERARMEPITAKGSVKPPISYRAPPTTGPTISPGKFIVKISHGVSQIIKLSGQNVTFD